MRMSEMKNGTFIIINDNYIFSYVMVGYAILMTQQIVCEHFNYGNLIHSHHPKWLERFCKIGFCSLQCMFIRFTNRNIYDGQIYVGKIGKLIVNICMSHFHSHSFVHHEHERNLQFTTIYTLYGIMHEKGWIYLEDVIFLLH